MPDSENAQAQTPSLTGQRVGGGGWTITRRASASTYFASISGAKATTAGPIVTRDGKKATLAFHNVPLPAVSSDHVIDVTGTIPCGTTVNW